MVQVRVEDSGLEKTNNSSTAHPIGQGEPDAHPVPASLGFDYVAAGAELRVTCRGPSLSSAIRLWNFLPLFGSSCSHL